MGGDENVIQDYPVFVGDLRLIGDDAAIIAVAELFGFLLIAVLIKLGSLGSRIGICVVVLVVCVLLGGFVYLLIRIGAVTGPFAG